MNSSAVAPDNVNVIRRIEKLEESLQSATAIIHVFSRQLEKLGIRFRVTRRTLKDTIAETAALAQKNSEITRTLEAQEDRMEKELVEVQKVLLAMQDHQQKQLELILAIANSGKLLGPERDTSQGSSAIETHDLKRNPHQMIHVAANDVAFSIHVVLLTAFTLFQISIYELGGQKVSKITILIVTVIWIAAGICVFIAVPTHSWLWLISVFNTIQVFMTVIKYIPQTFMNFFRKSTEGFSIGNILLDFFGGVTNYGQMTVQSIDQDSWVNFYENIRKTLLSMVSIFFDILFICQHYVLYPSRNHMPLLPSMVDDDAMPEEPLVNHSIHSKSEQLV